jgi:hypothetical protein
VGARVSSNSFGPTGDKQFFQYDGGGFTCYTYDLYARDVPDLLHVFAAGMGGLQQTSDNSVTFVLMVFKQQCCNQEIT